MEEQLKNLVTSIQQFNTEYKKLDKVNQMKYRMEYNLYQDFITFYNTNIPPHSLEAATKKLDLVIAKILEIRHSIV